MFSIVAADGWWLVVVGLGWQAFWAWRLERPTYLDAYYYAVNGQLLAEGRGFLEPIIWNFLDRPAGLPAPSHTYWMPLPSVLAAIGYRLIGGWRGAQIPFWLLAGTLPLLAYAISTRLAGERWQARGAALLTTAGGFFAPLWNQPETFAPFAWAGGLCLLFLSNQTSLFSSQRWMVGWLVIGVSAGLAHLTRADGILFLFVAFLMSLRLNIGEWRLICRSVNFQSLISNLTFLLAGYFLIMGGWLWRNWLVLGRPLATAGTQTFFLTTYDDVFAYGRSIAAADYWAWGIGNIIQSKLDGIWVAGQTLVAVGGLVFLTPFIAWGWVALARRRETRPVLRPVTWYALALALSMSVVFTFPGMRGGLLHSLAALWPWFMALAVAGIGLAVDWIAAHLPHWQPERAKRLFTALFIGVAFVISLVVGELRRPDDTEARIYAAVGQMLPLDAVVMAGNAPGFHYHTGRAAVSVPNEPPAVLLEAARHYGVTHLVLDTDHPRPLAALYTGDEAVTGIELIDTFEGVRLYRLPEASEEAADEP